MVLALKELCLSKVGLYDVKRFRVSVLEDLDTILVIPGSPTHVRLKLVFCRLKTHHIVRSSTLLFDYVRCRSQFSYDLRFLISGEIESHNIHV